MTKEEDKGKERFEVSEITTQTAPVIKDNSDGKVLGEIEILCKILNELHTIKKNIA